MSKLAQLAAARRAAAAESVTAGSTPTKPQASVEQVVPAAPTVASESDVAKPLSKLAQRVAAAKAAKAEADAKAAVAAVAAGQVSSPSEMPVTDEGAAGQSSSGMQIDDEEEQPSPLFSFPNALKENLPPSTAAGPSPLAIARTAEMAKPAGPNGPSVFFSLLTARPKDALVAPDTTRHDESVATGKHNPFSEPSPDDLVIRAREGTKFATRQ